MVGGGVEENSGCTEVQLEVIDVGGLLWFAESSDCYGKSSLESGVLGKEGSSQSC